MNSIPIATLHMRWFTGGTNKPPKGEDAVWKEWAAFSFLHKTGSPSALPREGCFGLISRLRRIPPTTWFAYARWPESRSAQRAGIRQAHSPPFGRASSFPVATSRRQFHQLGCRSIRANLAQRRKGNDHTRVTIPAQQPARIAHLRGAEDDPDLVRRVVRPDEKGNTAPLRGSRPRSAAL